MGKVPEQYSDRGLRAPPYGRPASLINRGVEFERWVFDKWSGACRMCRGGHAAIAGYHEDFANKIRPHRRLDCGQQQSQRHLLAQCRFQVETGLGLR